MATNRSMLPGARGIAGLGSPLKWSAPDKCLLVAFPTLVFLLVSMFGLSLYEADPELAPYVDPRVIEPFRLVLGSTSAAWALVILVCLGYRRRRHHANALVHATIQLWHVGYALASYFVGPLTSPLGGLVLVGALFGFMLFDVRAELWGLISFVVVTVATIVLERFGVIPYAPLFSGPPYVDGRLSGYWIATMGTVSLLIAGFVLLVALHVIREWQAGESQLDSLATTDALTQMNNRRTFLETLEEEFSRATRYGRALSVVIVDIDHFKRINDTYGHPTGDEALKAVAGILKDAVRRQDIVARYGGEEFALLLPETRLRSALIVAERCRLLVEKARIETPTSGAISLTVSLGIAELPKGEPIDVPALIARADEALYAAKEAGRNQVMVAGSDGAEPAPGAGSRATV